MSKEDNINNNYHDSKSEKNLEKKKMNLQKKLEIMFF